MQWVGSCVICGYNKCFGALELHHIDPNEKEFSFGRFRRNPKALQTIINELKKCVLLCANCHRELHNNVMSLNYNLKRDIDESFLVSELELKKKIKQQNGFKTQIKKDRRKIFLNKDELLDMLNLSFKGNQSALARYLNVSETAVRKRLK